MKKALVLRPDIVFKQEYNSNQETSLKILSMNNVDLQHYLYENSQRNPFLNMQLMSEEAIHFQKYETTLSDVIFSQISYLNENVSKDACYYLLSYLDSNGYFSCSEKELFSLSPCKEDVLKKTIHQLQRLDPVGCFCFHLKESLKVQAEVCERPESETAYILCDYLEELANRDIQTIMDQTQLEKEEIMEGFSCLQSFNPKPAAQYSVNANFLQPEARIQVVEGNIQIELIKQNFTLYFQDLESIKLTEELKQLRQQAKYTISFINKRNLTLLQILKVVCEIQKDYFIKGKELRRCTMSEVSQCCGLHISTISRAIQGKSVEFNRKYIPLRALFIRQGKDQCDSSQIIFQMKQWIKNEDQSHPLSDEKIRKKFANEGITIARRTIAKYRELEHIENAYARRTKGEIK